MKNIHILPTNKPSKLYFNHNKGFEKYQFSKEPFINGLTNTTNQHIYITNSEEIKEETYFLEPINNSILKLKDKADKLIKSIFPTCKKIILTTDQDLIKDGVQPIDDEFLEYFVNNPSCKEVEIEINSYMDKNISDSITFTDYKIIIPKEEPKQETLEEAKFNAYKEYWNETHTQEVKSNFLTAFELGAKWQQEQIGKSEFLQRLRGTLSDAEARRLIFEQFKNK